MTTTRKPYAEAFNVGERSPFRSHDRFRREEAAVEMLNHRAAEIAALEAALKTAKGLAKKNLRLRLQATKNNLESWNTYLEDDEAPRERRAVMSPFIRPNPLIVSA